MNTCCEKCRRKVQPQINGAVSICIDAKCKCHTEKPTHEIGGWRTTVDSLATKLVEAYGLMDAIWRNTPPKTPGKIDAHDLKDFIASLLTHQQKRIVEVLEGMKGNRQWECGRYDEALTDAIEAIKAAS